MWLKLRVFISLRIAEAYTHGLDSGVGYFVGSMFPLSWGLSYEYCICTIYWLNAWLAFIIGRII